MSRKQLSDLDLLGKLALAGSAGEAGQVLQSSGASAAPVWGSLNNVSASEVAKYSLVGDIATQTGTVRWYPEASVTVTAVYFSLGTSGSSTTTIDVKKNGVSIFGTPPSATSGQYKSSTSTVSTALATSDYLTIDVTAAGTGAKDAVVCIVYSVTAMLTNGATNNVISVPTTIAADTSYVVIGYLTVNSDLVVNGNIGIL